MYLILTELLAVCGHGSIRIQNSSGKEVGGIRYTSICSLLSSQLEDLFAVQSPACNMLKICLIRYDKLIDFAAGNVVGCTAQKISSICSSLPFISS